MAPGTLGALQKQLLEMNPVDIANEMSDMDKSRMLMLFRLMPKDLAAEVFSYLDSSEHRHIADAISLHDITSLIDEMSVDDVVDFLGELPSNMVRAIVSEADPVTRKTINAFLNYPENSAGSIMTVEFVCLFESQTCKEALAYIRSCGIDKETIYTCYVTDASRHLTGTVSLRGILFAEDTTRIADIMETNVVFAHTTDDQEEVAKDFSKYDLIAMPVLDTENRLVGIITIDDVMDVMEAEQTEDVEKMAALKPSDNEYLKSSVWTLARNRIVWLLVLMISATLTAIIIRHYEKLLSSMVALAAFLPMLMDTGGNSGSQASTLIVRGLAVGDIELKDWHKILWKELRVGSICAITLASVNFMRIAVFRQAEWRVNLVVSLTLACAVLMAKVIGGMLPLLAKLLHLDPALMASPLLTTSVDALTLAVYFSIATALMTMV